MKNIDYAKLFSDYGTLLVLLLLCIGFSVVTLEEQSPTSANAAQHLAKRISKPIAHAKTRRKKLEINFAPSREFIFMAGPSGVELSLTPGG